MMRARASYLVTAHHGLTRLATFCVKGDMKYVIKGMFNLLIMRDELVSSNLWAKVLYDRMFTANNLFTLYKFGPVDYVASASTKFRFFFKFSCLLKSDSSVNWSQVYMRTEEQHDVKVVLNSITGCMSILTEVVFQTNQICI